MIDRQAYIAQCYQKNMGDEMNSKAGRGSDQFMLRLPDGLRERIKLKADESGRSMNAEIVQVLERAYPAPLPAEVTDPAARHLLSLAAKIRSRPNPNAFRREQADLYERMARELLGRLGADADKTQMEED